MKISKLMSRNNIVINESNPREFFRSNEDTRRWLIATQTEGLARIQLAQHPGFYFVAPPDIRETISVIF